MLKLFREFPYKLQSTELNWNKIKFWGSLYLFVVLRKHVFFNVRGDVSLQTTPVLQV